MIGEEYDRTPACTLRALAIRFTQFRIKSMDNQAAMHVPFAELAPELRFFYSLAVMSATLGISPYLQAIQVAASSISATRVWDDCKFTPADALEFFRNSERLEPYLVHFAVKDPNFWCPRLAPRTSARRNRK